jgi:4,5-DOPA dioxygenase extradiol
MESTPDQLGRLQRHGAFAQAVPTPDHFIPLLYLAGLASAARRPARALVDGYAMGSLSMTSYALDAYAEVDLHDAHGSPPLPDAPPDETNI